jgi:hypothetical protein
MVAKIVFYHVFIPRKESSYFHGSLQFDVKGWTLEIAGNGEVRYIEILTQSAGDLKCAFVGPQYGEANGILRSAGCNEFCSTGSEKG